MTVIKLLRSASSKRADPQTKHFESNFFYSHQLSFFKAKILYKKEPNLILIKILI